MEGQKFIYNDTTTQLPPKKNNDECNSSYISWLRIIGTILIASFGMLCNGVYVGWSTQAASLLPDTYSPRQSAWISSSLPLGAAISALFAHKVWPYIGIRTSILCSAAMMIVTSPFLAVSQCYWSLFTGRLVGGMAVGVIQLLVPVYIQDISPTEYKSTYGCILQTQFAAGILTMYFAGLFESIILFSIILAFISLLFLISFFFVLESPRYLCMQEKSIAAREIISKFKEIDIDVEHSIRLWSNGDKIQSNGLAIIYNGTIRIRVLITVLGLIVFEQLIGAIPMFFYMQKVLTLTGGDYSPEITAILCCFVFAISISFPNFFGQNWRPKSILLWTTSLMGLSLITLGVYCHYKATFGKYTESDLNDLPMYLLSAFYFLFAIGPFRLTWFYVEKLIPEDCYCMLRSVLMSASWLIVCGVTRILPGLIDFVGVGWIFWFMAIMCLFATLFVSVFVPSLKIFSEEHKLFSNSESGSVTDV